MPSNDSPAFDVLNASEYDLWEWAVKRAGAENAATYIREATLKAARDTDLARARVEGAREALTRLISHMVSCSVPDVGVGIVQSFRDREYPAPKPAECRLSDGSVVGWNPSTKMFFASRPDWYCQTNDWRTLAMTVEDFATLKAFAATRTEGTDGR